MEKIKKTLIHSTTNEKVLITDLEDDGNVVYEATGIRKDVYKLLKEGKDFQSIKMILLEEYDIEEKALESDLQEIKEEFKKAGFFST